MNIKNKIIINVTKCKECPFAEKDYVDNTAKCYAPTEVHEGKYDIEDYYDMGIRPDFCPLIKNNLTINTY